MFKLSSFYKYICKENRKKGRKTAVPQKHIAKGIKQSNAKTSVRFIPFFCVLY